jgi:hypothetical protein
MMLHMGATPPDIQNKERTFSQSLGATDSGSTSASGIYRPLASAANLTGQRRKRTSQGLASPDRWPEGLSGGGFQTGAEGPSTSIVLAVRGG